VEKKGKGKRVAELLLMLRLQIIPAANKKEDRLYKREHAPLNFVPKWNKTGGADVLSVRLNHSSRSDLNYCVWVGWELLHPLLMTFERRAVCSWWKEIVSPSDRTASVPGIISGFSHFCT